MSTEQRRFRTDPLKLKRLRVAAGLRAKDMQAMSGLDRTTVAKILRGDEVYLKSLTQFASGVFEIDDPTGLLHPDELASMGIQTEVASSNQVLEWSIVEHLSGWKKTSNGLQFQLVKLSHRFLPNRMARGKCYELRHLSTSERERLEQYLLRHVEVCEQIGEHKNVAGNLTAAPIDGLWWVLDRWEDGESLEQRLKDGPLSEYELRVVMKGVLNGLEALHKSNIIRRELTPSSILLRERDNSPVLTDMELAKLVDGAPTVSPEDWPDDPYRALEVEGDVPVDVRADLYSWARIFVHAAAGQLPDRGDENVDEVDVPDTVKQIVTQCLSVTRTSRPKDVKSVIKAAKGWE